MEELNNQHILSSEDKLCEKIFTNTTKQLDNGTFQVDLPLISEDAYTQLGNSFNLALKRFYSLEKRLSNDKQLFLQYKNFIDEYVRLKHGEYVDFDPTNLKQISTRNFLPHHAVIREESSTTRLRVVFDASMKTTSGYSLNDIMLKGYPVQPEPFDILCRFRTFRYVLVADIEKMYRMIKINPHQR